MRVTAEGPICENCGHPKSSHYDKTGKPLEYGCEANVHFHRGDIEMDGDCGCEDFRPEIDEIGEESSRQETSSQAVSAAREESEAAGQHTPDSGRPAFDHARLDRVRLAEMERASGCYDLE